MGWMHRGEARAMTKASISPSNADLAWAAGFLEGEGCFSRVGASGHAEACQVNEEPIVRLQTLFGGTVSQRLQSRRILPNGSESRSGSPIWRWRVSGARARGIMFTLFHFLSARRRGQILAALGG